MLKVYLFIQAFMLAACCLSSDQLSSMLSQMTQHDAALLNLSRSYLLGLDAELLAWCHAHFDPQANLPSLETLNQAVVSSWSFYPMVSAVASGIGFFLSLPMFGVYLVTRINRTPKIRFYLAFWMAWLVLAAYHAPAYVKAKLYVPLPYEWALFPVVTFLCGALCMIMTPQSFKKRFSPSSDS